MMPASRPRLLPSWGLVLLLVVARPVTSTALAEELAIEPGDTEESAVAETVAEESAAEESVAEESAAEESVAEESAAEESVAEESVAEESAAADTVAAETVPEETSVAEMATEGKEPVRMPVRPFGVGESFKFSLQYGPIKAGTATLAVEGVDEVDGVPCYRLASTARSNRVFSTFYKVRDRVESFIDVVDLATRRSTKDLREKDYHREEVVVWDQTAGRVTYQDGQLHEIEAGTRDILGAFYYVRTFAMRVGDRIPLQAHDNEKSYEMWIEVLAEETIDTPVGRFDCFVVEPQLLTDGLFKRSGSLKVWLTRDNTHKPVMMQSKIKLGAVSAILVEMQPGQRGPITLPASMDH